MLSGSIVVESDAPAQRFDVSEKVPGWAGNPSSNAHFANGNTAAARDMQVWAETDITPGARRLWAVTSRAVSRFQLSYLIIQS